MFIELNEIFRRHLGWCPRSPVARTAPALLVIPPDTARADQAEGSGPSGRFGRIRSGITIAAESLKAVFRDRRLLIFPLLFTIAMFLLSMAEFWYALYLHDNLPFTVTIAAGSRIMAFDPWFFLVEMICLSCFTYLVAVLALHRSGMKTPATIRERLNAIAAHTGSLTILSLGLALVGTHGYFRLSPGAVFGGEHRCHPVGHLLDPPHLSPGRDIHCAVSFVPDHDHQPHPVPGHALPCSGHRAGEDGNHSRPCGIGIPP